MKLSKKRLYALGVELLVGDDETVILKCKLCDGQWDADPRLPGFWLCPDGCNNLLTKA